MRKRPANLPDFERPPLEEVVIDLQFEQVPGYTIAHALDIRAMFRQGFPNIQTQPLLPPNFETFGGTRLQSGPSIQLAIASSDPRLWLVSADENHLLQLQNDRFIANWRKGANEAVYPRFESIIAAFEQNFVKLNDYFAAQLGGPLKVKQAEVAYHNLVEVDDFAQTGKWFSFWATGALKVEAVAAKFSEVLVDDAGGPWARLHHELQSVHSTDGEQKALRLALTVRGKPQQQDLSSAVEFVARGRAAIVTRFSEITTSEAHKKWGRRQ